MKTFAAVLWFAFALACPSAASSLTVAIQPLGAIDVRLIRSVARGLQSMYRVDVTVLPARALPSAAYYAPRHRYRGERILADLETRAPARAVKVIGLMSRDLSVTKGSVHDWGVLGVAGLSKKSAVVSVHRLGRGSVGEARVAQRLERVAIHELGHTFGLPHCPTPGCIMNDAAGTIRSVDRSSGRFCEGCRRKLGSVLRENGLPAELVASEPREY